MMKSENKMTSNEPICKKIQNYIFKFSEMLGKGNFSKVYKAHHQITNETVAIKIIELNSLKSQKLEQLLFSQIDVLKKLNHPNILRCFEVFTSNRNCYIITEICNGGDLETKLRREHHFSEASAQPIIKDIFCGLLYLAQRHVIHRDLKVANVFLHNGRAKIADFGFAKFTKENFKDINIGSPIYMSPQGLIHNIYGPKTDIWAFGILVYELLHGQTPFAQCRTEAELKYHVSIPINPKKMREELSHEIRDIITLCMEIDQSKRVSAMDLQKLPYFQRLLDKSPLRRMDSPMIEKKYSTASQKYVGPSSNTASQQSFQRQNFLVPRQQRIAQLQPMKKSSSPMTFPQQPNNLNLSPYEKKARSTQKRYQYRTNEIIDPRNDIKISEQQSYKQNNSSKIFSGAFTFKQSVNLLHYCRLIYKYVILLKQSHPSEENQIRTLSGWVLHFMDEIKSKMNEGAVIYEGDNGPVREKKLREVTNQYTKKYNHELGEYPVSDMNLNLLLNYVRSYFQKIDTEISMGDDSWVALGHYIVMIVESTSLLKKCYEEHNYSPFSSYKEVENFLNRGKEVMDVHSYKIFRKKVSNKDRYN